MTTLFRNIFNFDFTEQDLYAAKRDGKLISGFTVYATALLSLFVLANIVIGDYDHALNLFLALVIFAIPTISFIRLGKIRSAETYFLIVAIAIIDFAGFSSILQGEERFNEYMLLGVSSFVLVLYGGLVRHLGFLACIISSISMYMLRVSTKSEVLGGDELLAGFNILFSYISIYFFVSLFKKALLNKNRQLSVYSEKLSRSKKRADDNAFSLRSMINSVPLYMGMLDPNGRYIVVNSRFSEDFGKSISEIEGELASNLYSEELNVLHENYIERAVAGLATEFDRKVLLKGGKEVHILGKMVPLFDESNNVKALVEYGTDITEMKNKELELENLNAIKNQLIGVLSHDLKSPLHSLSSLLAMSDEISPDELKPLLDQINIKTKGMLMTLEDILSWGKVQIGGGEPKVIEVNLRKEISMVLSLYHENIEQKRLTIEQGLCENIKIKADSHEIGLVCRNIISNAIKFTPNEGKVRIGCEERNGHTLLSISDSGVGMTKSQIDNILNRQVADSVPGTAGEKGTGLGLGFCMDVLKKQGSRMEINSELGIGTTFNILFNKVA